MAFREGSTVKPRSLAKILTAMIGLGLAATACSSTSTSSSASAKPTSPQPAASFLGQLSSLTQVASTVPANGDVNPYGVAAVPASEGPADGG